MRPICLDGAVFRFYSFGIAESFFENDLRVSILEFDFRFGDFVSAGLGRTETLWAYTETRCGRTARPRHPVAAELAHDHERDTLPVWMPRIASACNVGRVVSRACENPRRRESRYRFY